MRHPARILTALALTLAAPGLAAAQNPLEAIRKGAADVKKAVDAIKRPAADTSRTSAAAPASRGASPNAAQGRSGTKVEEQVLVQGEPGLQYEISPRGQHVAAVVLRGSRMVLVRDGVEGPRFDEILLVPQSVSSKVVFSGDGNRYAYVGRQGQEWVVMVDGKELARGTPWSQSTGAPSITGLGFAPGGKHLYFTTSSYGSSPRSVVRLYIDGTPGPASEEDIQPLFSPNGERHAYVITGRTQSGQRAQQLILDGKPSPYPGGEPQFTADGIHVFTRMPVRGADGIDIFADGKPFMRVTGATLHMAPSGAGVLGVVWTPFQNGTRYAFLTVANRRVPNSECRGNGGIEKVYFSPDAKYWAVKCQDSNSSQWVMANGKKGRDYQSIIGRIEFLADGRPVYTASMNNRQFVVVGEEELGPYQSVAIDLPPGVAPHEQTEFRSAVVSGNRYGFVALPAPGQERVIVVDGKSSKGEMSSNLAFSPDGSRFAYVNGRGHAEVVLDGARMEPPLDNVTISGAIKTFTFSPDGKHIAYASLPTSGQGRGVAIDNKLFVTETAGNFAITFTPDSKHLAWIGTPPGGQKNHVYVDGERVLEVDLTQGLMNNPQVYTSMGSDGVFTVVAQHGGAIKRFRITPGTSSIESMAAKAVKP